jgi:hypothetical protein
MKTRFTSTLLTAVTVPRARRRARARRFSECHQRLRVSGLLGNRTCAAGTQCSSINRADGPGVGTYVTQTSHGTWLFPPNPNGGGSNG